MNRHNSSRRILNERKNEGKKMKKWRLQQFLFSPNYSSKFFHENRFS